jgi:Ca-activated chloride channel homolog
VTFGLPISPTLVAQLAAGAGALIVVAYVLKMRRRRHEVPFSKLWQKVLEDRESSSLWRRLKRLLSLLGALLFAGALLTAALDPKVGAENEEDRSLVIIVDASASMKASEAGSTRIDRAKREAKTLLTGLGGGDAVMIVRLDGQPTPLTRFETDPPRLTQAVDGIKANDTPADLPRALRLAADALRGRKQPMIVLIGDGAYPAEMTNAAVFGEAGLGQVDLEGLDVRFVRIGGAEGEVTPNVGIVAFNVRRYLSNKLSYEVLLEVQNFGDAPVTRRLTLWNGNEAVDVKTLSLRAGERRREIYPDRGGGDERTLRAEISPVNDEPGDGFPLDDTAWALLPERKKEKVLLVTEDNLYLEGALLLDDNLTVDKLRPAAYPAALARGSLTGYDVVVYEGFTPEEPLADGPAPAAVYFKPRGPGAPIKARGEAARPFVTDLEKDHPITRWVALGDVNFDRTDVLVPEAGDVVIARSVRDPMIVAGKRGVKKFMALGFGLDGTDLPLRVAFPILIVNALDWFAGQDAELLTTYRTGRTWAIPVDPNGTMTETTLRGPAGIVKVPVTEGRARFYGQRAGIYEIDGPDGVLGLAANLADPAESALTAPASLSLGGKALEPPPTFSATFSRSLWVYLALAALFIVCVEWVTYNRRITV